MKKPDKTFLPYVLLVVAYVVLNLAVPVRHDTLQRYNLTLPEYHILILAVIIPVLAIWFAAFYGYGQLRRYCRVVKKTPEAKPFSSITHGFKWLAWGLPITTILSTVLGGIAAQAGWFRAPAVIVDNYASLVVALGAFYYINQGTRQLNIPSKRQASYNASQIFTLSFILLAVTYCYFIFRSFSYTISSTADPYHLPHWMVMLTLVAPYLYAWFIGTWSAVEIATYEGAVKGVFYKRALRLLAAGIGVVILSSVLIQYITSISARLSSLDINAILLIVYTLLILYALGFVLVAAGAKKLRKIEEI